MSPQVTKNNFFPEYLADIVKNQEELDAIFLKHPNLSKSYIWTAVTHPDVREWYEKEWPKVQKYLDKDFLKIFQTIDDEYISRSWEFHLASVFLKYDLKLKEKTWKEGPDFCIEINTNQKIWIEAIACTRGTEDAVEPRLQLKSGEIYSEGGNIEDINRPRALRITSAIGAKLEQYKNYLKKGIVSDQDYLVIAVNGQAVQHKSVPGMLFKYAIFGQGPDILVKVPGQEKMQGGFYKPISTIKKYTKDKQEEIPPHFMEMDEFAGISAVIYCGYSATSSRWNSKKVGDDFLFAYHCNPTNPIPDETFKFGRSIRKNLITGSISDVAQARSSVIFLGFLGPAIEQEEKIVTIDDDYECWNLKKFSYDEFLVALKEKIPPINANVLRNYEKDDDTQDQFGLTKKQFEQCSWGLFIPESLEDSIFNYGETLFLINLYSPEFLYPLFYVGDMGIMRPTHQHKHNWEYTAYWHEQNQANLFKRIEFPKFFKLLLSQGGYGTWMLDRAQKWDREDWRLFVASRLFSNLKDYDNGKDPFEWQRESGEMGAALESLFTAGDTQKEEIIYRLTKRAAVLLLSVFPTIEKDIKKLYGQRSSFVHGELFNYIAKESKHAFNNIPSPDFDLLAKQREYVRWSLAAYLYLAKLVKEKKGGYGQVGSVIQLLEQSIINLTLREQVLKDAQIIFDLLPRRS